MQRKQCLLFPFIAFLFLSLASQAQTSKGTVLLGGSVNYSQRTNNSSYSGFAHNHNYRAFSISPNAGYFLADNLAVGTGTGFNFGRSRNDDELLSKSRGWGINPFARYYKFLGEKVAVFGQGGLGFNKMTNKNYNDDNPGDPHYTSIQENLSVGLMPGISYFPTSRIGFQFTIGQLQYVKSDINYHNRTVQLPETSGFDNNKSFNADFGLSQAVLGLNFFLSK